jgi:hypothetical protein
MNIHPFPVSFPHRFEEPDLSSRDWQPTSKINEQLQELWDNEFIHDIEGEHFCDLYVKHHMYCAACGAFDATVYDDKDLLKQLECVKAGDYIEIWSLTETPKYFSIKCPNKDGLFPNKGAY